MTDCLAEVGRAYPKAESSKEAIKEADGANAAFLFLAVSGESGESMTEEELEVATPRVVQKLVRLGKQVRQLADPHEIQTTLHRASHYPNISFLSSVLAQGGLEPHVRSTVRERYCSGRAS
jgi:hypothetical protein